MNDSSARAAGQSGPRLPSGTVTFLFTDIEGSTKLAREHPDTWETARARHHAILRSAIESNHGYIFQTIGDSFSSAFHAPGDAIRAAVKAQIDLHNEKWDDTYIRARMGIHTGQAEIQPDGQYQGYIALSQVQRVMSAGHGGQVLLSFATQELVHDELPEGVELLDLGEWQLKDVIHPVRIYQLLIPGLPAHFGPLRAMPAMTSTEEPTISLLDRIVHGKLIGRERELTEANLCWQKTIAGENQVLLISGEPGVGKTRFTRELIAQLETTGANILLGECYAEGGAPYGPIAQIIEEAFTQDPSLPHSLPQYVFADLLTLAPALHARYADIPINEPLEAQADQERIYDSVLQLCVRLSLRTPLLLFLDDVHWSDPGTLFLLRRLARRSRAALQARPRMMIVMTYREVELSEARALHEVLLDLNRERLATRIKLTRLSRERTRDMLAVMFAEEITPEFSDGIFRETEGNPFFIEEVCKTLIETGKLTYAEGHWHHPGIEELEIPQSVRLAIQARVERLTPQAQEALAIASVIGREFDFEILLRSGDQDEDKLIESLESAASAQLLEEVKGRGEEKYSFVHALIPTTLYEGISARRRRRAHERVAKAIEEFRPDDFETLAHHFEAADDAVKAIKYSRRAAQRAESLYAYDTAIHHLRVALDFVEPNQPDLRRELLEELADILSFTQEGAQAVPLYQEVITLWGSSGDDLPEATIRLHRKIIKAISSIPIRVDTRRFKPVLQESKQVADNLVQNQPPNAEAVRLLTELSREAWYNRMPQDWDSAETYARQAVQMAEQLGTPVEITDALEALSNVYGARGLLRERVDIELRRLELSRDARFMDLRKRVNILAEVGAALVYVGEYAKAMPQLLEAERLASQNQDLDRQFTALRVQSHCLYQMDQWDQAINIEEKWRALEKSYPNFIKLIYGRCFQIALNASVHARRGELKQAAALREESRAIMLDGAGGEENFTRAGYY